MRGDCSGERRDSQETSPAVPAAAEPPVTAASQGYHFHILEEATHILEEATAPYESGSLRILDADLVAFALESE